MGLRSAEIVEICAVTSGTAVQDKGALLLKGKMDMFPFVGTTIGFAFLLFIVSAFVENLGTPEGQRIWYAIMSGFAILYMYTHTRNLTEYRLYENGLKLKNRIWKKEAFYRFDQLEEARPGRSGKRTRQGMVYHDYLALRFKDGGEIRFGVGDIEEFYVFRNALLQQIGYFEGREVEDESH
jgi:hypothetical protein